MAVTVIHATVIRKKKKKNTFQENEYYESDRTRYESGKRYIVYILPIPEKMINNK